MRQTPSRMFEQAHILVIEDDAGVRKNLKKGLQESRYTPICVRSGSEALQHIQGDHHDLVLLDLGLPDMDGMDLLELIRQKHESLPIIVLTARDAIGERVTGLERGADDYITKPFAFIELVARINALLRRSQQSVLPTLSAGALELDPTSRHIQGPDGRVDLTPKEFDLLNLLVRHANDIVPRDMIARSVWQEPSRLTSLDNIIDVHISHLREKIKSTGLHESIHTVRGIGYSLVTPA